MAFAVPRGRFHLNPPAGVESRIDVFKPLEAPDLIVPVTGLCRHSKPKFAKGPVSEPGRYSGSVAPLAQLLQELFRRN
jgi:hypothetical protein